MMASRAGSWEGLGQEPSRPHPGGNEANDKIGPDAPLFDRAKKRATELYDGLELQRRVEQNPVGMLAVAWGIGFVLGGGLTSSLTRRALEMGGRAAMKLFVPMLAEKAWSMTRNAAANSSRASGKSSS